MFVPRKVAGTRARVRRVGPAGHGERHLARALGAALLSGARDGSDVAVEAELPGAAVEAGEGLWREFVVVEVAAGPAEDDVVPAVGRAVRPPS